jgi:hypothetical protein
MSTYSAKSSNGRIEWILSQGQLTEIGPSFPKFTMSAIDTKILFGLLAAGSNDIINAAQMEQLGIKVQKPDDYVEEDYVEGVEVE